MTNSAPKMNNRIERHGSPNNSNGGKRQHRGNSTIKTTPQANNNYFNICGGNNTNTNSSNGKTMKTNRNGRLSFSPTLNKNISYSPIRYDSSGNGSPTNNYYAGAKFSEPPSPATLPKPPTHWTNRFMNSCQKEEYSCSFTNHLKMILNVQA